LPLSVNTFTDFGHRGPYLGQLENRMAVVDPSIRVTHLVTDAPAFDPRLSGRLLQAVAACEGPCVFLAVVDPGVGGERQPVVVNRGDQWFVGPDNGLFAPLIGDGSQVRLFRILYRPEQLSMTFHGRDLFAPVAARLAASQFVALAEITALEVGGGCDTEIDRIIYADRYGNLITGRSGDSVCPQSSLSVGEYRIGYAPRFDAVGKRELFWYVNSLGLVEIARNQGSAAKRLGLNPGDSIRFE
jgi:S-adenosylmethionine hydrolase